MKKRLIPVLSAVLVLSFLLAAPAAAIGPNYWTGNPDPMKCDFFHDCYWVIPVCIGGTTFQIGLYFDPSEATPGQIEAMALYWTNTVLTDGVCPWVGYSVPHVILYKSTELTNGYGIIVSTKAFASKENIMSAFGLTAIPADLKEVCEGPVVQMSPVDTRGTWACDQSLIGILPYSRNGMRLPLISSTENSLQKIYETILSWPK